MEPRWLLVQKRNRCQRCTKFVETAWLCYTSPAVATACYCEPCVEKLLQSHAGGCSG